MKREFNLFSPFGSVNSLLNNSLFGSSPLTNENYRQLTDNSPTDAYNQPIADFSAIQPSANIMQQSYSNQATNIAPEYVSHVLATNIRNAINSNLPDSYTVDSPEVNKYTRKVISVVETGFSKSGNVMFYVGDNLKASLLN